MGSFAGHARKFAGESRLSGQSTLRERLLVTQGTLAAATNSADADEVRDNARFECSLGR
jgi:hypothetical protein